MKHLWRGFVAALVLSVVGTAAPARAQMAGPYQPPIPPLINLVRGGATPAVNYFNIVQPQMAFNAAIGQLGAQQGALGQSVGNLSNLGRTTGHPVLFGNLSHYYGAGIGMGGGGGGGGGASFGAGLGAMGGGMGMGGMGMGGMGMGGMGMMGMGGMGMMGR